MFKVFLNHLIRYLACAPGPISYCPKVTPQDCYSAQETPVAEVEMSDPSASLPKRLCSRKVNTQRAYIHDPCSQHPSVQQMMKYSIIGSKVTVKAQVKEFLEQTQVNELIAVIHMYDANDRVNSYKWFAENIKELN